EVVVLDHRPVDGDDEHAVPEPRDVAQDLPEVREPLVHRAWWAADSGQWAVPIVSQRPADTDAAPRASRIAERAAHRHLAARPVPSAPSPTAIAIGESHARKRRHYWVRACGLDGRHLRRPCQPPPARLPGRPDEPKEPGKRDAAARPARAHDGSREL